MHEAFEMLPFAGQSLAGEQEMEWEAEWEAEWETEGEAEWEAEWEDERWRPGGARVRMRGGGLRPRPPLRGQRRPAPPRYRGWGPYAPIYPTIYPTIFPQSYTLVEAASGDQQGQDQDLDQDDGQVQGEVPPTLAGTLGRVPEAAALRYQALGTLATALRDPRGRGAGLYLIEFDVGGRRRAYSGQTDDLHRRLLQHRLCGQMMGVDLSAHQVYVAPLSSAMERRRIEQRIHDDMFAHRRGVLTNQRRELELAVLGEMWV